MTLREELGLTAQAPQPKPTAKRKRGRPCLRDWERERPTIELLIRAGYGSKALSHHYAISGFGMRAVLKRLGMATQWQDEHRAEADDGAPT